MIELIVWTSKTKKCVEKMPKYDEEWDGVINRQIFSMKQFQTVRIGLSRQLSRTWQHSLSGTYDPPIVASTK